MSKRMITTQGGCVQLTCVLDTKDKDVSDAEQWLQDCADRVNTEVNKTMRDLMIYDTAAIYLGNCVPPQDIYTLGEVTTEIDDPDGAFDRKD